MSRYLRSVWVSVCAVALAGGSAWAQDEGGEGGGEVAPTPEAMTAKPAGKIKAGAKVLIPSGFDDTLEIAGPGGWIEVTPWAELVVACAG